jgi:transcriptional regulator with XRE-family HTH domain
MKQVNPIHYRDLLADEFARRKRNNPGYSLRAFARDLGISPATLSQVLSGKRDFKKKSALRVADKLAMPPDHVQRMLAQARGDPEAGDGATFDEGEYQLVQDDIFRMMSEWYYFAILNLAKLPDHRADSRWISARLGISVIEARNAVSRLTRLGYIEIDGTRMKRAVPSLTTTDGVPSSALRAYQKQNLKLAEASLDRDPVELRDMSSLTMAVSREEIPLAKAEISRFKKRFARLFKSSRPSEVYTLALQLFPVTKNSEKGII